MKLSQISLEARRFQLNGTRVLADTMSQLLKLHPHAFGTNLQVLSGWVRSRSFKKLLEWANGDEHIPTAEHVGDQSFLVRRQFVALVKKHEISPKLSGMDPEGTAVSSFHRAEWRCYRVNQKFRALRRVRDPHSGFMDVAAKYIERTIGLAPDLKQIYSLCDFGGGASVGVHGDATNIGRKLLSEAWSCTPTALPYAREALWHNPQIALLFARECSGSTPFYDNYEDFASFVDSKVGDLSKAVQYNKLSFVPKTAKTHRVIAVEPLLNGFVQKGVDAFLCDRLLRRGIDIHDQSRNQELARRGSLQQRDPYVTLDLSAASDTISIEVARRLLPPEWFVFLNAIRSPSYELNGKVSRYHKFCSMGNGFCFPLETLIFAAICHAAYRQCYQTPDFLVYGDDIIVRQNVALLVYEMLKWCGFKLNTDKSFFFGPFRESCGADWLQGRDITPVYMREPIRDLASLINFHNSLYVGVGKQVRVFPELCDFLLQMVPEHLRIPELFTPTIKRFNSRLEVNHQWPKFKAVGGFVPLNTGFLMELDQFMANPHSKWDVNTQSWYSEAAFTVAPCADTELVHPLRTSVEYLAILRGSTSQQPLSLRRKTRTRVATIPRVCPFYEAFRAGKFSPIVKIREEVPLETTS